MFEEWVPTKSLTKDRPADPGENASGDNALVKNSDDYRLYRSQLAKAARELIDDGICTAAQTFRRSESGCRPPIKAMVCISCTAVA